MIFTVKEIAELAAFAGLTVVDESFDDEGESEIQIISGQGRFIIDDDGSRHSFPFIAWFNEYPEEGAMGIGKEIDDPVDSSPKT